MLDHFKEVGEKLKELIDSVSHSDEIEKIRIEYLSRKGQIPALFSKMKDIENEKKKEAGQVLNELKNNAFDWLNHKKKELAKSSENENKIDLSLPGRKPEMGKLHPLLKIGDEVKSVFRQMGFSNVTGPEVETEYYIFDALNMPEWHPARKVTDTLYINKNKGTLLRTETSSVQIRTMEKGKAPFRIISLGNVYRNEKENATHVAMFSQCEGLYVDKNVSFAELKGTLKEFFKELYGKDTKIRFRPHYFPFTEPSAEVDVTCFKCGGKGCKLCKSTGWIEIAGCGMVNPKVLEGVGVDSEEYSGFAFGLGIERLAMLKYGVDDLRHFYENDLRFLEQF